MRREPVQFDRPLFSKRDELNLGGRYYNKGEYIPAEVLKVDTKKIMALYKSGQIYHNPALEDELVDKRSQSKSGGDGLDSLTTTQLNGIAKRLNKMLEAYPEYSDKKKRTHRCPMSTIKDKQIGHIRRWRSMNSAVEDWGMENHIT